MAFLPIKNQGKCVNLTAARDSRVEPGQDRTISSTVVNNVILRNVRCEDLDPTAKRGVIFDEINLFANSQQFRGSDYRIWKAYSYPHGEGELETLCSPFPRFVAFRSIRDRANRPATN